MNGITLTERAARRIGEIMASEPQGSKPRISVNGGGCSGFQYAFDVERTQQEDDVVVERDGAAVLVDQVSLQYMDGRSSISSRPVRPVLQDREPPRHRLMWLRNVVFSVGRLSPRKVRVVGTCAASFWQGSTGMRSG